MEVEYLTKEQLVGFDKYKVSCLIFIINLQKTHKLVT